MNTMAADHMYVPQIAVEWIPPPIGTVKLNFDGGLCRSRGCAISAGIFRDQNGAPLYSYTCADPNYTGHTSYEGEANALAFGLDIALRLGFTSLWVEGDAKLLINVALARRPNFWYDEGTISRIQYLMTLFPNQEKLMLTFIEREGNEAANALVLHAREDVLDGRYWVRDQELPNRVAHFVNQECNGKTYVRKDRYVRRPNSCYIPPASLV